eukprot:m.211141 g.211141  ORF g.211141 m.211141 type:complete len:319 (+) comp39751_c0_seq14:2-958(+)
MDWWYLDSKELKELSQSNESISRGSEIFYSNVKVRSKWRDSENAVKAEEHSKHCKIRDLLFPKKDLRQTIPDEMVFDDERHVALEKIRASSDIAAGKGRVLEVPRVDAVYTLPAGHQKVDRVDALPRVEIKLEEVVQTTRKPADDLSKNVLEPLKTDTQKTENPENFHVAERRVAGICPSDADEEYGNDQTRLSLSKAETGKVIQSRKAKPNDGQSENVPEGPEAELPSDSSKVTKKLALSIASVAGSRWRDIAIELLSDDEVDEIAQRQYSYKVSMNKVITSWTLKSKNSTVGALLAACQEGGVSRTAIEDKYFSRK